MKKRIGIILLCVLIATGFYLIGYQTAKEEIPSIQQTSQTFYVKITDLNGDQFAVQGLEVNDINFRGEFTFSVTEETALLWRGTAMKLSEFDIGDSVSITFTGAVLESYPAVIQEVTRVQLLDDEK